MTGIRPACARSRSRRMFLAGCRARRASPAPRGKSKRLMTSTSRRAVRAFGKTECGIRPASAIVMPDVSSHRLKEVLQTELELPRRVRRRGHAAAGGGVDVAARVGEIHRVEEVERLGTKFERRRSIHAESLEDRKIDVPLIVTTQN